MCKQLKKDHGYVGLHYKPENNTFIAELIIDGQRMNSHGHDTPKSAAKAYDLLCIKYGKEPRNGFYSKKS